MPPGLAKPLRSPAPRGSCQADSPCRDAASLPAARPRKAARDPVDGSPTMRRVRSGGRQRAATRGPARRMPPGRQQNLQHALRRAGGAPTASGPFCAPRRRAPFPPSPPPPLASPPRPSPPRQPLGGGRGGSEALGMRWQRLGGRAPPGRCPPGPRRPCLRRGPGGRGANVRTGLLGRVKQPRHLEPLQHPPAAGDAAPGDGAMAERRGGRPSLRSLPPVMLAIAWSGPAAYVALSGASLHLPHPPGVQPRARQMALGARCQGI